MYAKNLFILLIVQTGLTAMAQENCKSSFDKNQQMDSITLSGLSSVFRTLKFENGPCNNRWGSDLQLVMEELGKQLGVKGTPYGEVFKRIGPPDEKSDTSEIVKLLPGESILIYHWRGRHDFLYFITENKVIKRSDWWYAYE